MGIKSNFSKFLRENAPNGFTECKLSDFAYKRVAVDLSLFMHKYKAICGDRWLTAFINLVVCLRKNEIHAVFILDGKSPQEKQEERSKRRDSKQTLEKQVAELELALETYKKTGVISSKLRDMYKRRRSPAYSRLTNRKNKDTNNSESDIDMIWIEKKIEQKRSQLYEVALEDFEEAKALFDILDVPYFIAPWEAEKLCSKLCIDNKVDAVLSEDTDVLAYGAPLLLTKIDTGKGTCVAIDHESILSELEIDKSQFLDICIMCGTDYNKNISKIGSKTAYKYILKYGDIDSFAEQTGTNVSILNHVRVREMFSSFEDEKNLIKSVPYCGHPNMEKLVQFVDSKGLNINLEKIKLAFAPSIIVIEGEENNTTESDDTEEIIILDDDEVIVQDD